jgi:hypothetical protein
MLATGCTGAGGECMNTVRCRQAELMFELCGEISPQILSRFETSGPPVDAYYPGEGASLPVGNATFFPRSCLMSGLSLIIFPT